MAMPQQKHEIGARHSSYDKTLVEYFAGIGLVGLGLQQAGWRVVYANDFSPEKYQMYRDAFGDGSHYKVADVFDLAADAIPLATLATCSFPCIDLSLAGKQNGLSGKHSSAFWGFIRVLERQGEMAPPIVLLENVSGWLHSNEGQDFRLTIKTLNDLGYACDVFELDAIHFVPQSRPRIFVVGTRLVSPLLSVAPLLKRSSALLPSELRRVLLQNKDLRWCNLYAPEPPPKLREGLSKRIVEQLSDDDPRWWSDQEVERHLAMMAPSHRQRVEVLAVQTKKSFRTVYRRMRAGQQKAEVRRQDVAGCLRTARGGSSKQILLEAGDGKVRMRHMTPREYARLQGVPEDYAIHVPDLQALTGFGDAVCVPVFDWIGRNVLNPLLEGRQLGADRADAPEQLVQFPLFTNL